MRKGGQHELSPHNAHLVTSTLFLQKLVLTQGRSVVSFPVWLRAWGRSFASRLLLLYTYLAESPAAHDHAPATTLLPIADMVSDSREHRHKWKRG
jgi:hypothetical protein